MGHGQGQIKCIYIIHVYMVYRERESGKKLRMHR